MRYYLECLFKNKFSRFSVFGFIGAGLLLHYNHPYFAIILAAPAMFIFFLTGFGMNSYGFYRIYYKQMSQRGSVPGLPTAHCSKVGFSVACDRLAVTHPEIWRVLGPAIQQAQEFQDFFNNLQ